MNKREVGSRYEEAAAAFLQKKGLPHLGEKFPLQTGGDRPGVQGRKRTGIHSR